MSFSGSTYNSDPYVINNGKAGSRFFEEEQAGSFLPVRRPLLAVITALTAAVGVVLSLFPPKTADLEAWRGQCVTLTGTVCGLEPRLEGETTVWRMTLSDIVLSDEQLFDVSPSENTLSGSAPAGSSLTDPARTGAALSDPEVLQASSGERGDVLSPGKKGLVLCVLSSEPAVDMGARIRVRGTVIPFRSAMNEGEFDVRLYYHILRVAWSLRDVEILAVSRPAGSLEGALFHIRNRLDDSIDRCFSQRNAPAVKAMLLGEKGLLDEDTKELYQGAGIIHILSISGLHLSLIGMGLFTLLGKLRIPLIAMGIFPLPGKLRIPLTVMGIFPLNGKLRIPLFGGVERSSRRSPPSHTGPKPHAGGSRWRIRSGKLPLPARAAVSLTAVFLYGKMTGMGTSAFRAFVMLSLFITAKVIGRTYDLLTAAAIAAALLLLDQPLYLLHTGFQFSFCAVLAMGILLPALPGRALKTAAIPLGTLPVSLWTYGTFPLWSLLLNLLVLPLMTVVMGSAGAAVLLMTLFPAGSPYSAATAAFPAQTLPDLLAGSLSARAVSGGAFSPAALAAYPAETILDLYRFLAEQSERLPFHRIVAGRPAPAQIALYSVMLFALSGVSAHVRMPHVRRILEMPYLPAPGGSGRSRDRGGQVPDRPCRSSDRNRPGRKKDAFLQCSKSPVFLSCGLRTDSFSINFTESIRKLFRFLRIKDNRQRRRFGTLCAGLWLGAAVILLTRRTGPAFEMDFLYVGQGDGIYISCEGMHFLIDGGSSSREELAKYTLLPFLRCKGTGRLDGIILTHEDIDHCSAILDLLEAAAEGAPALDIGHLYLPEIDDASKGEKYREIEDLAARAGIPVSGISRGQRIRAGSLTMDCLHPARGASYDEANEYSTTLLLRRGDFSALLTGDLEGQGEEDLLLYLQDLLSSGNGITSTEEVQQEGSQTTPPAVRDAQNPNADVLSLPVTVLKTAHHGSRNATSEAFLRLVAPENAVISAGIRNLYGHPHAELLDRLSASLPPDRIFRTDLSGQISLKTGKRDLKNKKTSLGKKNTENENIETDCEVTCFLKTAQNAP